MAAVAALFLASAAQAETFRNMVEITVKGGDGASALANFPLLVRVSESALPGFRYSDVVANGGAGAIRFEDAAGSSLPSECDTWDETGESLFWVRIPVLSSEPRRIRMLWNLASGKLSDSGAEAVWDGYAAVLHMGEDIDADAAAAGTVSKDSTANGLHAVPTKGASSSLAEMMSAPGAVGLGRVNDNSTAAKGNYFTVAHNPALDLGGRMTLSFWLRFDDINKEKNYPVIFQKRSSTTGASGFEIEQNWNMASDGIPEADRSDSGSNDDPRHRRGIRVRGSGNSSYYDLYVVDKDSGPELQDAGWMHYDIVYDGGSASVYVNGELKGTGAIPAMSNSTTPLYFGNNPSGSQAVCGRFDEIRITGEVRDAAWIAADYAQQSGASVLATFGPVAALEGVCWIESPAVTPNIWYEGEAPNIPVRVTARAISDGEEVPWRVRYRNLTTGAETAVLPDVRGSYEAVFYVPRSGLSTSVHFDVLHESPGSVTTSDRVLTFSKDTQTVPAAPVEDEQNANNTDVTKSVYWRYLDDTPNGNPVALPNLQRGMRFELRAGGSEDRLLWRFEHCRLGNTFLSGPDSQAMVAGQNYLPVSRGSTRYDRAAVPALQLRYGASVAMQNTRRSCIYSPCYEDGIGTVYFDAVNGWTSISNAVVVEVCRGAYPLAADGVSVDWTGAPEAPTDENCALGDDPFGRCRWEAVDAYRYVIVGGAIDEELSGEFADGAEIPLDCTTGARCDSWFRIRTAPVNIRSACRFRIRRADGSLGDYGSPDDAAILDADGMVLLDNIICTAPAVSIGLDQFGEFRLGEAGRAGQSRRTLGQCGAFNVAYPSDHETNLLFRAKVTYDGYTNSVHAVDPDGLILSMRARWRWRRLDQSIAPWSDTYMRATDDRTVWEGVSPLPIADADGTPLYGEGDIEYSVEAMIDGPYSVFNDYTGTDAGVAGYSERDGVVKCSVVGGYNSLVGDEGAGEGTTFVRLREGRSSYETMYVEITDGTDYERFEMELVGDGLWRGFIPATNTTDRTVRFSFLGVNRQTDGATEFVENLESMYCAGKVDGIPCSSTVDVESGSARELVLPADHTANYYAFTLNEYSRAMSIANADRQTFDMWNNSRIGSEEDFVFSGSLYATNSTGPAFMYRSHPSGVSLGVTNFISVSATSEKWFEPFNPAGGASTVGYEIGVPFETAETPYSSWTAEYGAWASQYYSVTNGLSTASFALEMQGKGLGRLTFRRRAAEGMDAPNGLDTVSFSARLSQLMAFEDVSYSRYGIDRPEMSNCTVAAQVQVDESRTLAGFDGDASVSLVLGYVPGQGCYEYRVTIVNAISNAADNVAHCRHEIYKWAFDYAADAYVPTLLYSTYGTDPGGSAASSWGWKITPGASVPQSVTENLHLCRAAELASGMFFSMSNETDSVYLTAGVTGGRANKRQLSADFTYTTNLFCAIGVRDSDPVTKAGTYGFITKNSPAKIYYPRAYEGRSVPFPASFTTGGHSVMEVPLLEENTYHSVKDDAMVLRPNRLERFEIKNTGEWGFAAATNVVQTVNIEIQPLTKDYRGNEIEGDWVSVTNVAVSSYRLDRKSVTLRSPQTCNVRFRTGSPAMGIVIDDARITQWCGGSGSEAGAGTYMGYRDYFYYNNAWVSNATYKSSAGRSYVQKVAVLAPRRAPSKDDVVAVRSPWMSGLGSVTFSYVDADPGSEVLVQWREMEDVQVSQQTVVAPGAADDSDWNTVARYTLDTPSGTRTTYLGERVNGVFRIAIPQETVAKALQDESLVRLPNWRAVTIKDMSCTDEPSFDERSWWGWNFLTTGWHDGRSGDFGSIWDGGLGGVGVLNSTVLDASTLANGKVADYKVNNPFFQSPTFTPNGSLTNWIGEISFRTRAYSDESPSCVTVWGAGNGRFQLSEDWTPITNIVVRDTAYRRVTVKCADDARYAAVRLGVANAAGLEGDFIMDAADTDAVPPRAARAVIDDVVVLERGDPDIGFRLDYARPFRMGLADRTAVANIDSRDQQPLLGEQFGFQAEVQVGVASDDIDLAITPRVYLSYYVGSDVWGHSRWKDAPGAVNRVELLPAEGTNLVYRSMSENPASFVPPVSMPDDEIYGIVQYFLEVRYWMTGENPDTDDGHWAPIGETQWRMPSWNAGFDDPNLSGGAFSPFTLLETIAPGRAWINEVNYTALGEDGYSDMTNQFIEICFPGDADMTGWQLYCYKRTSDPGLFMSGERLLYTFGDNTPSTKSVGDSDDTFAFFALKSPQSTVPGADWSWNSDTYDSELTRTYTYAFQLVRPSKVIEEQIVVQGMLSGSGSRARQQVAADVAELLNETFSECTEKKWTYVCDDTNTVGRSASVEFNTGATASEWADDMVHTPGRRNERQVMPEDWYIPPMGGSIWLRVVCGDNVWVVGPDGPVSAQTMFVPQNLATNIVFETAPWHRLGSLVRDGEEDVAASASRTDETASVPGRTVWQYEFSESERNSARLEASAAIDDDVILRGDLDPDDPYTPAVIDWLLTGVANGKPFAGSRISTNCVHWGIGSTDTRENGHALSLKTRYWLDIDPTDDAWDLRTGWAKNPAPVGRPAGEYAFGAWEESVVNMRLTFFAMISNKNDTAESVLSYPPYRLQGLGGEKSDEFPAKNWTSETFKVTAVLQKHDTGGGIDVKNNRWPLSFYVFGPGSFGAPGSAHPYQTCIEVLDFKSPGSPAYGYGWGSYERSEVLGYGVTLDDRNYRQSPDLLTTPATWDGVWQ